jgi:hypothetical protein
MQRIRKQFGAAFADALAKCPTLVADLQVLRQHGVRIRKVGGHCQAYSNHFTKSIYIGSKCNMTYQLVGLGHEKVHVLDSPTPNPVPGKTGRREFIDMCLNAETDAIVHEVQIVSELLAAGYKVDSHSLSWYRRFKRGGRFAIRKAIEEAVTSNTGEKYPEYYGGWYDEAVKPKDRLPFHRLQGERFAMGTTPGLPLDRLPNLQRPIARKTVAGGRDLCPRFCPTCQELDEVSIHLPKPGESAR